MSSAVLTSLEEFLKRYTIPSDEVRFFSRSHIFIAFRAYLTDVKPHEIVTMDFETFTLQLNKVAEDLQLNTKKMGKTTYFEFHMNNTTLPATEITNTTTPAGDEEKINIQDINIFLCCKLCCGYLVDATTITECLHSFCKSCILKHFQLHNSCPICGVVVHNTTPVSGLKPDIVLQDIVNKLLPGIPTGELHHFAEFEEAAALNGKHNYHSVLKPYRPCNIYLQWVGPDVGSIQAIDLIHKYIRLPDHATVAHISQFVCNKLEQMEWVLPQEAKCFIQSGGVTLPPFFTLRNIYENSLDFESKNGFLILEYDFKSSLQS
uniref:Polycomb group RING finger protein 1 n=1 Tax=Phallusia mammillata TaxID=59560 RepID=A0A6F9DNT6_9ASCI|nr:polycomb group RING finger protein 1 [Phallusia mammillata]